MSEFCFKDDTEGSVSSGVTPRPPRPDSDHWEYLRPFFMDGDPAAAGRHPFDLVTWKKSDAIIKGWKNGKEEIIFEQREVEFPDFYSDNAVKMIAQKYFRGRLGTPQRETSLKQVIGRVAKTLTKWGVDQGYFSKSDAVIFENELTYILLFQMASFNSPVWFNVGIADKPQCSACFINSIEDSMDSIIDFVHRETNIFKRGSGSGANFSNLRSSKEQLSGGGYASGPVSFMKGFDAMAGVIKSGGKTRRAAKMAILDTDHPDIREFIWCKAHEEKKAKLLRQHGILKTFDEVQNGVFYQNANNSVRATDGFMKAVENGGMWTLKGRVDPVREDVNAKELFHEICQAAWECGDPGMQFDDNINLWHTTPASGRQRASNPCSEFMYLDDTSCNLASINLVKFRKADGTFDIEAFNHVVDIMLLAQEIIVDGSAYPTEAIMMNSHQHRPLGLGYLNLGMYLALEGVPYDSEAGRTLAAGITALMHGRAYHDSARFAERVGQPFPAMLDGFDAIDATDKKSGVINLATMENTNRNAVLKVLKQHQNATKVLIDHAREVGGGIYAKEHALFLKAMEEISLALVMAEKVGVRNSQVSLLAPTGTISYFMDAETTGIEPQTMWGGLKNLAGGGVLFFVNPSVGRVLSNLGYKPEEVAAIIEYMKTTSGRVHGAPHLNREHYAIFDTALGYSNSQLGVKDEGVINVMGHIKMMAAVQPFLSGAISKTVNMPESATVEDFEKVYMTAWKSGLKAVALYRDGCKAVQPLNAVTKKDEEKEEEEVEEEYDDQPHDIDDYVAVRWPLPDERPAVTHKFKVGDVEGYFTVGMYPDTNRPGEIFIMVAKEGSFLSGVLDAFATSISLNLQHGVPLQVLINKFKGLNFEPRGFSGYTGPEPELKMVTSIIDYIFKWLEERFLKGKTVRVSVPLLHIEARAPQYHTEAPTSGKADLSNANFATHNFEESDEDCDCDGNCEDCDCSEEESEEEVQKVENGTHAEVDPAKSELTGDLCPLCGGFLRRTGTCKTCTNCKETTGCG